MASSELAITTWLLLGALMAGIFFLVYRGARKTQSMDDYALGNIMFSPVAVGLALAASMTSAATFIINPGFIALNGLSAYISFGVILPIAALISLVFLTKQFRKQGETVKAQTMAQWIGKRYGNEKFGFFFAILSLLLITFIVLICVGLTKVIAKATNTDELYVLIGLVVFIFGYMMFGGANSMVYTNTAQAVIMVIVAVLLLTSGREHFADGISGFFASLSSIKPELTATTDPNSFLFRDWFEIAVCQIVVGIAIVCQPHIITKSLLLKRDSDVNKYLLTGVLVEILFFSVVFVGFYARLAFPDLSVDGVALKVDGIVPAYVVKEFPVYVGLAVILGLIAAGLSTLEGLIQSLSTTITTDILKVKVFANASDKTLIQVNRIVIAALAVVSILLSYNQLVNPSLSVGIFAQNGVYAYFSAAFIPVVFGIFMKNSNTTAVVLASVTAVVVHFAAYYGGITHYLSGVVKNPGVAATYAILASTAVALIVQFLVKPQSKLVQA